MLEKNSSEGGISVRIIDMHTIKPIDEEEIIKAAERTRGIINIEDGNIASRLGAAACQVVSNFSPVSVNMIGILKDVFTIIGPSEKDLWDYYGISVQNIIKQAQSSLKLF